MQEGLAERIAPELRVSTPVDDVDALADALNELGDEQLRNLLEGVQNGT